MLNLNEIRTENKRSSTQINQSSGLNQWALTPLKNFTLQLSPVPIWSNDQPLTTLHQSRYLPSSRPTQTVFPAAAAVFWRAALASSGWLGSDTNSKQWTGARTWKLFTERGVVRFREKISTWPGVQSPPLATCKRNKAEISVKVTAA